MKNIAVEKVWVVIPAYNEEKVISETISGVLVHVKNVVIVDDCSTDNTLTRAESTGVHVLRHIINLGQGASLQTGIEYALKNGADFIVTFDADGQHDPAEILTMLSALLQNKSEVALGSRFIGRALNMPWQRKLLLKMAITFTRLVNGIKLTDVHNGFRIMTRSFCEKFKFQQNRMAHASEIISFIASHKVSYVEFPVTINYTEYSKEKGQRGSNALKVLMELFTGQI